MTRIFNGTQQIRARRRKLYRNDAMNILPNYYPWLSCIRANDYFFDFFGLKGLTLSGKNLSQIISNIASRTLSSDEVLD